MCLHSCTYKRVYAYTDHVDEFSICFKIVRVCMQRVCMPIHTIYMYITIYMRMYMCIFTYVKFPLVEFRRTVFWVHSLTFILNFVFLLFFWEYFSPFLSITQKWRHAWGLLYLHTTLNWSRVWESRVLFFLINWLLFPGISFIKIIV